jgi:hypothetical protein
MYMKPADDPALAEGATLTGGARAVVVAMALALLLFGVWPNRVLDLARAGGEDLKSPAGIIVGERPR